MFLDILIQITLPVFLLIGAGILADRAFKIDLPTLTRLCFNVLLPALVFIKTLDAGLSPAIFGAVTLVQGVLGATKASVRRSMNLPGVGHGLAHLGMSPGFTRSLPCRLPSGYSPYRWPSFPFM